MKIKNTTTSGEASIQKTKIIPSIIPTSKNPGDSGIIISSIKELEERIEIDGLYELTQNDFGWSPEFLKDNRDIIHLVCKYRMQRESLEELGAEIDRKIQEKQNHE